uniref:Uncharacterized protein n=1 Tax=Candidatus Kentrum sp. LFY TaxID=2126342 RepID=A0A450WCH9_9GAMM|nr:MAG: hypothetical protein BECKLFY1418C_GA0070996_10109 [Candidatus Kentron sp. LFY]
MGATLTAIFRKGDMSFRFHVVRGVLLAGLLLTLSVPGNVVSGNEQSVCMVTRHDGDVSLAIGNNAQSIQDFMTLRHGDRLSLAQGGEVKLVCFGASGGAGRVEVWFGPAVIIVNEGKTHSDGRQPVEIRALPAVADFDRYTVSAEDQPMAGLTLRTVFRGVGVARIVDDYCHLRQEAPMGNFVPEHYLFSNLTDRGLLGELGGWLQGAVRRDPKNSCWQGLISLSSDLLPTLR